MTASVDPSDKTPGWAAGYTSSSETVAPEFYFGRRLKITSNWGPPIESGHSVLNLGCGDGYYPQMLIEQGIEVHACDIAETLLEKTRERIGDSSLLKTTRLDINETPYPFDEPFDHVVALMRSFYQYAQDPVQVLSELAKVTRRKLILDFNPRKFATADVVRDLQRAGFREVRIRAFLVPAKHPVPWPLQRCLLAAESIPPLYKILTRKKFYLWAMAEK